MALRGTELIKHMEDYAPIHFSIKNDRIGLQVGDPQQTVKKVLVTLDVTEAVVDEAIGLGANWIIAHHAVIFQPLKALRVDTSAGKIYQKCLQHGINIYIAHTNLDVTTNGVNDVLAQKLSLQRMEPLFTEQSERLKKLVVFVPETHVHHVHDAISKAGAGWIGNYSHCSFQTKGVGTFLPCEEADPYIGTTGKLEKVNEIRLETIVTKRVEKDVLQAMINAHPYEEVAYDLYPLSQTGKQYGLGRIGEYPETISLAELAHQVKQSYGVEALRIVGNPNQSVKKIAILGGSGARYWHDVLMKQADVYITGDIDFHSAQDALAAGLALIDPGHHVEHLVVDTVCEELRKRVPEISVFASKVNTNPFRFM